MLSSPLSRVVTSISVLWVSMLLFLGVIEALYWGAPSLVSQDRFRTGSGYLS